MLFLHLDLYVFVFCNGVEVFQFKRWLLSFAFLCMLALICYGGVIVGFVCGCVIRLQMPICARTCVTVAYVVSVSSLLIIELV